MMVLACAAACDLTKHDETSMHHRWSLRPHMRGTGAIEFGNIPHSTLAGDTMGGETKRNIRQRNDRDDRKFLHCSSAIQVYFQMFTYQFDASRTEKGTHRKQKRESKSNPNETERKKKKPENKVLFP
jgi:hypothetical protein